MNEPPSRCRFLTLPVELRLHIAAHALEPQPLAGLREIRSSSDDGVGLELDAKYNSSVSLSIRLVCRQFNVDFTRLAVQKTRFVLRNNAHLIVGAQPEAILGDVKRLIVRCDHSTIVRWERYPFNKQCLDLDELDLVIPLANVAECKALVGMFRRVQNVKKVGFVLNEDGQLGRMGYYRLIGAMLKEDHYQRYDAPNAPNVESQWWNWTLNGKNSWASFIAQEPKPIMDEHEYMVLMKPRIDEVMEQTASMLS